MIIEGYSADVYCDNVNCSRKGMIDFARYRNDTFTGKNKTSCDRQRKKHGWRKVKGMDVCPECIESKVELDFG